MHRIEIVAFIRTLLIAVIGLLMIVPLHAADWPLDLHKIVNREFVDQVAGDGKGGWSDQGPGNSLTQIVSGTADYSGVRFNILDPQQNENRSVAVMHGANTKTGLRTFTIDVPRQESSQVRALYLLHTLVWVLPSDKNKRFGSIHVNYPKGNPIIFDLLEGRDAADWWRPHGLPNGTVGYRESNGESLVGLYLSRFELPVDRGQPESIVFTGADGPTWVVVAATVSDIFRRPLPPQSGQWTAKPNEYWKPFDQSDMLIREGTALDFSGLVEPGPAGKHGFVMINKQGLMAFADNPRQPIRFLCASWGMDFPAAEEVDSFALQIRRRGYNAYRPHYLAEYLMEGSSQDLVFNSEHLQRWDQLSAALKKQGIYLAIDLISSNTMFHHEMNWTPQGRKLRRMTDVCFDPAVQEHWKKGVRMLLEHVNPYTGTALKDEPQVIYMTMRNEPSLQFQAQEYWNGHEPLSPTGQQVLDHFRHWLKRRYGSTEALAKAWTVADDNGQPRCHLKASQTLQNVSPPSLQGTGPDTRDLMRFFMETEQNTFRWMSQYITQDLGVKVPLNDYNNTVTAQAIFTRSAVPMIDIHGYHDHPTAFKSPGSRQSNTSLIACDADIFCRLASVRELGKPMICTEWGQPFWNSWRRESGLVVPSYASLQNWQLLTQHAWNISLKANGPIYPFRVGHDPVLSSADQMAALLFLRGDVASSSLGICVHLDAPQVFDRGLSALGIVGPLTRLALIGGLGVNITGIADALPVAPSPADLTISPTRGDVLVRLAGAEQAVSHQTVGDGPLRDNAVASLRRSGKLSPDNQTDVSQGIYQSDTGQLLLNRRQKLMTVNTPRSLGATLAQSNQTVELPGLTLTSHDTPAAVLLGSLTNQPIVGSDRLLLIVATDALNSDMTFTDRTRTELVKLGQLPVLLQTIRLTVSFDHDRADRLALWALAANGRRVQQLPLKVEGNRVIAIIDTAALINGPTPYFELMQW